MVCQVLAKLKADDFNERRYEMIKTFIDAVERFIFVYDQKKVHKLVFYLLLRAEGDILLELKEYDFAIKAYKSLKNYCKRWQRQNEMYEAYKKKKMPQMRGCHNFDRLLISLYHQIGTVYREAGMHNAAMDYFKKQLILAWQSGCQYYESLAYLGMAQQYFYINAGRHSLRNCLATMERYVLGHREQRSSDLRRLYVEAQNANNKNELMALRAEKAQNNITSQGQADGGVDGKKVYPTD